MFGIMCNCGVARASAFRLRCALHADVYWDGQTFLPYWGVYLFTINTDVSHQTGGPLVQVYSPNQGFWHKDLQWGWGPARDRWSTKPSCERPMLWSCPSIWVFVCNAETWSGPNTFCWCWQWTSTPSQTPRRPHLIPCTVFAPDVPRQLLKLWLRRIRFLNLLLVNKHANLFLGSLICFPLEEPFMDFKQYNRTYQNKWKWWFNKFKILNKFHCFPMQPSAKINKQRLPKIYDWHTTQQHKG